MRGVRAQVAGAARAAPACACAGGGGGGRRGRGSGDGDSPWGARGHRPGVPAPAAGRSARCPPRASGRRSHDGRKGGSRRRPRPPQPRSEPPRVDRRAAVPSPAAGGRAAGGGRRSAAPARQDRGTVRRRYWPAPPAPATAHWPPRCTIVTSPAGGRSAPLDPRKTSEKLEGARAGETERRGGAVAGRGGRGRVSRIPSCGRKKATRSERPRPGRAPLLCVPGRARRWPALRRS